VVEKTVTFTENIRFEEFPVLNESEEILVLVDEAHRSHTRTLHRNLRKALPNAAIIGFTGTPILSKEKKETREIFGDFIDKYILQDAELDGATVPILYEGRTADGIVKDAPSLDAVFEDKRKFASAKSDKTDPLSILVVMNMLLTGFDAPVEQVLYLDRKIVAHDLLQAIARVNRTGCAPRNTFPVKRFLIWAGATGSSWSSGRNNRSSSTAHDSPCAVMRGPPRRISGIGMSPPGQTG
jgi:type I site-specific restriction-modification system R (restriction) subunit